MTRITVIGLGEAGSLYARGLRAAGAEVLGYDLRTSTAADIPRTGTLQDAVASAELVLSLVWARTAVEVAEQAIPLLDRSAVFADLNTAAREVKAAVADVGAAHGVAVADVAVLAPVPRAAERTPLLASGHGAARFADLLVPLGAPVEVLPGPAGDAAQLKLLRSVFMKGIAAVVIEGLSAARAVGAEAWLHDQMAQEFGPDGAAKIDHLVTGTYTHVERREHEVRDALAVLEAAGQHADMTRAAVRWYRRILSER
jgi:3-hydroxyisobutyrate dehydrogenase-like beta-hydroxyacid dehydrogenase